MALYFDFPTLLSYEHTPVFFGNDYRYKIQKNFSVNGILRNWENTSGVSGSLRNQDTLLAAAVDYQPIFLNDVFFGEGKITNIRFNEENIIQESNYQYDIQCYETGNLFNALTGYFSGVAWDSNTHLIESLSEELSYERQKDGAQNYSHSVSIDYNKFSAASGINLAKAFALNLFNSTQGLFPFLGQYQNLSQYKKLYVETFNLIDGSCSFAASSKILPNETGGYSYSLQYDLKLNEDGYTDITENCDIQGTYNPRAVYAQSGYNTLITGSFSRSNSVYSGYAFSTLPLYSSPLVLNVSTNKFEGKLSFSNTFSNNPKYRSGAIWEYQLEIQKDPVGYISVAENGTVKGLGRPLIDKFSNAQSFYNNTVLTGIDIRLSGLYAAESSVIKPLITTKETMSRDEYKGEITYSREKTDDNTFINASGMKRYELDVTISNPVHLVQNFNIFNQKEFIQPQNTNTQGQISINLTVKGKRTSLIQDYLTFAAPMITEYSDYGSDTYLDDLSYRIDPLNNNFSMSAQYLFLSGYKTFGELTID